MAAQRVYKKSFIGPIEPGAVRDTTVRSNMIVRNPDGTYSRTPQAGPLTPQEQALLDQNPARRSLGNVPQSDGLDPFSGLQTGGALATQAAATQPLPPPPAPQEPALAAEPTFGPTSFNGNVYNDLGSLNDARRGFIDSSNRESLSALDRALLEATGSNSPDSVANINQVGENSTIGRSKSALMQQVADLLKEYDAKESQAKGNLNSYYSNLGDAYQSSQGVREGETTAEYSKARTDARTQQQTGIDGLQRTLTGYLNSDRNNRTAVAKNYTTALDSAQNSSAGDLSSVLGRDITPNDLSVSAPTVTGSETGSNSALLNALKKGAGSTFRLNNKEGANDTSSVLKYLYSLA